MKKQFLLKITAVAAIFAVMLTGCAASETTGNIVADGVSFAVPDNSAPSDISTSDSGLSDSSDDKTSSDSSEDKTSSDNSEDKTSSESSEDKTSSDSSEDKTSSESSDDKTSSESSDDKTSSESSEDKTSSESSDDKTTSGNVQTQNPQTAAPTTKAPQTDPPATKAPQTDPPATKAPQTNPPATKAPAATKAPEKPAACTNHKWEVSRVITAATCESDGKAEYTCAVCGAKKTDTVAKGHSWRTEYFSQDGYCIMQQTCTVCGWTNYSGKEHEYNRTKNVESTSTKDGYTTYACAKCGDSFTLTQKAGTNNNMPMKYNDIYNKLIAFKSKYKEGMPWDNNNVYKTTYTDAKGIKTNFTARGCVAFALELSDSLFKGKDVPKNYTFNINKLRIGDMLRINNDAHTVIILDVGPEGVVVAEGNYNSSIHWGRFISASELKQVFTYSSSRY